MKGFEDNTTLIVYVISNTVALLILLVAWKRPRLARLAFFFVFVAASWVNWNTARHTPDFYMAYADFTWLSLYKQFIRGWFRRNIAVFVGLIAICQAFIAVSILMKGWVLRVGASGAVFFLIAIAPLGIGSAFPFSIIASIALCVIINNPATDYLWVGSKLKYGL